MKAAEIIENVSSWNIDSKIKLLESYLKQMVILSRSIWSNDEYDDPRMVSCFKWSNELAHVIWNLKFELEQGTDDNCMQRVLSNMKFYIEQEPELAGHFGATLKSAYERVKNRS